MNTKKESVIQNPVHHGSAANTPIINAGGQERSNYDDHSLHDSGIPNETTRIEQLVESSDNEDDVNGSSMSEDLSHDTTLPTTSPPTHKQEPRQAHYPYYHNYGYQYPQLSWFPFYPPPPPGAPYANYGPPNAGMPYGMPSGMSYDMYEKFRPNSAWPNSLNEDEVVFSHIDDNNFITTRSFILTKIFTSYEYESWLKQLIQTLEEQGMESLIPYKRGKISHSWDKKEKRYLTKIHNKCVPESCMPDWMSKGLKNGKDFGPLLLQAMQKVMDKTSPASTLTAVGKFRYRKGDSIQNLYNEALRIKCEELENLRAEVKDESDDVRRKCIEIWSKHIEETIVANTLKTIPDRYEGLKETFESDYDQTINELFSFLNRKLRV